MQHTNAGDLTTKISPTPNLKKSFAVRKTKTNSDLNVKTSGCYATRRHSPQMQNAKIPL